MAVLPRSSYYDKHYKQAPALIRARRPYLIKNALTGTAIFAFAIGVYAFTIRAVAQDEFEDVHVPDFPAQSPQARVPFYLMGRRNYIVGAKGGTTQISSVDGERRNEEVYVEALNSYSAIVR